MPVRESLTAVALALLVVSAAAAQAVETIVLPWAVLADGKRLSAGTSEIRVTGETPQTPVGQSPNAQRWMELVLNGQVVDRELAVVLGDGLDAGVRGSKPPADGARVDILRGGDYARVWIHHAGDHYLLHLPSVR